MPTERLQVILQLAAGQYKKEAREAAQATGRITSEARTASTSTQGMRQQLQRTGSVIRGAAVAGAFYAVGNAVGSAIERAEEMTSQYAITEQVIKQTGGAARVTAEDVKELSRQQSILTGVDKAVITEGNNVILTFKNIRNEVGEGNQIFDRTSNLMLDVATVMQTSVPAAAQQLSKALNDPISQLGALGRAGLTFSDAQEDQIKTLVRSGDLIGAQKIILEELETQLGGTAAASADASDKISNAFSEIAEAGGTFLLPFLDVLATELQHAVGLTDDLTRFSQLTGQNRDSAENLAGALNELGRSFGELNHDTDNAKQGEADFREEAEALIDSFKGGRVELERTRDGLDLLVEKYDLSARQAAILADILDIRIISSLTDAEIRARLAAAGISGYAEAQAEAGEKSERAGFIKAIEDYKDIEAEARGAADAVRAYLDAQRAAVSPAIAAVQSLDRYNQALIASNDAIKEFGSGSKEANDAGLKLLDAYSDLIADAQAVADVTGVDLTLALKTLGGQAGLTDDQIQFVIDSLRELDGIKAEAEITATFQERGSSLVRDALRGRLKVGTGGQFDTGISFKAAGGPLGANQPAIVGERGPELFIPRTAGQIVSSADLSKLLQGINARQVNYNIPVTSTGSQSTDAQLVGSIASVLRRMETI